MSIPPRDATKRGTVTRSRARKNPTLAKEIEQNWQGSQKPKKKAQQNIGKNSQGPEMLNSLDQTVIKKLQQKSLNVTWQIIMERMPPN